MTKNNGQSGYGIRRLILINSGMYAYSIFPIDRPLSVCGQNNSGKSTAINALQFLFLADMRDMDFGKHDHLTTRKFYFPGPGSYVLAEIQLEHGFYTIGAAGTGPASQYSIQHFVYQGLFDPDDFRRDGHALPLNEMLRGLRSRGVECFKVAANELRNMLLGVPGEHSFDLTVIPLRGHQERYIHAWVTIFKNLLHMRNVNSQELKQLLLKVFDIRLVASDVDFAHEYQRVNAEVNRLHDELSLLQRIRQTVSALVKEQENRQELRGKLHALYPEIRDRKEAWDQDFENFMRYAKERRTAIEPERQELAGLEDTTQKKYKNAVGELATCSRWLKELEEASAEFELVENLESLDAELSRLETDRDQLVKEIGAGERVDSDSIERDIAQARRQQTRLTQILDNWGNNVWGLLNQHFSVDELRDIFRVLNEELLHLPLGENGVSVDDENAFLSQLKRIAAQVDGQTLRINGARISLASLGSFNENELRDPQFLEKQLEQLKTKLERLEKDLQAAHAMDQLLARKKSLEDSIRKKREFRDRYSVHLKNRQDKPAVSQRRDELTAEVEQLERDLKEIKEKEKALDRELQDLQQKAAARERIRQQLEKLQEKVHPFPPTEPAGISYAGVFAGDLADLMEEYALDWADKVRYDDNIHNNLESVETAGAGAYLREQEEASINSLLEAINSIPQREELLEKAKRTAIAELGNSLKGLLDNYNRLVTEISTFNRAINKRTISNLTKLELRLEPNERVKEAIEELVKSGQWGFLSDESRASDAANYLYKWVSSQGRKLNLTHLFELCFAVFSKEGRETVYRNLDRIESHGTTITIKALINMHMMEQLLDDRRLGDMQMPYYLDEAASIDPGNQCSLVEQGLKLGFVPILASVKPQTAASYCVKISGSDGQLFIDESCWVELDKKTPA